MKVKTSDPRNAIIDDAARSVERLESLITETIGLERLQEIDDLGLQLDRTIDYLRLRRRRDWRAWPDLPPRPGGPDYPGALFHLEAARRRIRSILAGLIDA